MGLTDAAIASRLQLSEHTAIRHVANLRYKFHVANRTELAALAIATGLVTPARFLALRREVRGQ